MAACVRHVVFSLTLTLSRWEREQPLDILHFANGGPANPGTGARQDRRRILPLPAGEGRGEGESARRHHGHPFLSRSSLIQLRTSD